MGPRGTLRRAAAPYLGRAALRRWAFLVLGGALVTPFWFLTNVCTGFLLVTDAGNGLLLLVQFLDFLAALPLVALASLLPLVRPLEAAATRTLLDADLPEDAGAGSKARTAAWCVLHLGLGGIIAGATLALPPAVVYLLLRPIYSSGWGSRVPVALAVPAAIVVAAVLLLAVRGAGAVLSHYAEPLLGPSAADRLAAAEHRATRLAERNRLARDLHDSVGHALSVVTLQAAAAARVMDSDPAFTRRALAAIEESARGALDELDHALGLLREEETRRTPQPDLRDVAQLAASARAAGTEVELATEPVDGVLPTVSREAYRIVQEALTNALKHAPGTPVRVAVATDGPDLAIAVTNPLPPRPRGRGGRVGGGGRGVAGMRERVTLLGGECEIGPRDDVWALDVRLPWGER